MSPCHRGVSNSGAVASEWVIDGETTLENTLASEFVYGGAFGFEQFYGFGFELSGDAAAALQQSLQPTWIPNDGTDGRAEGSDAEAPAEGTAAAAAGARRRMLQQQRPEQQRREPPREREHPESERREKKRASPRVPNMSERRLLSDEEAQQRNLPKGAQLIAQVRKPLPKEQTRLQIAEALRRRKQRKRRKLLQETGVGVGVDEGAATRDGEFTVTALPGTVEEVTGEDIAGITSNWFDSFPAALPTSIRDRLLAQLEEFVLDPQVSISLEIAIAFVGVVEPGVGIVSAEAADETTVTYDITFHGYDASVDVAANIERAQGVAASASAGVAISKAIVDAAEVIDAVTDIINEVNGIVTNDLAREEAQRLAADGTVAAQSGPSAASTTAVKPPKIIAAQNKAEPFRNLAGATRATAKAKIPNRVQATAPIRVSAQGTVREFCAGVCLFVCFHKKKNIPAPPTRALELKV